ncbi:MAG: hypothetical protein IKX97_07185, partial [Erysipelotrichaceae bacterium]|nr:hypothetical protein [Erysipelotrichaceae bacterium]
LASFSLTVTREPGEDVGTYEIYVKPDEDCVVDVVTKEVAGTLTITPAPLTVRTGSNAGQYTGSPITESTASITGFKFEDTATVTATGSQTEIGASKNTYRIDWGETNPENYTIIENLGTLTVYPVRPSESARRSQIPLTGVENSNRIQQLWKLLRNRKDH